MEKIKVLSPENIEIEYSLAGLGSRAGAVMIDYLIQGVLYFLLGMILIIVSINDIIIINDSNIGFVLGGMMLVFWIVNYFYFVICEMTMNGATPGKRVFKMRTVRKNGMPITIKHSLIRNLFRLMIDNYFVGIVLIFFRKDRKRIGDMVSSTMVVGEEVESLEGYSLQNQLDTKVKETFITEEEKELIQDYFKRKDKLDNSDGILDNIYEYFKKNYPTEEEDKTSKEEYLKSLI